MLGKSHLMVDNDIHLNRSWMVDNLANDFDLWDVWEVPINADNTQRENFSSFYKVVVESFMALQNKTSVASILFDLRNWIAKIIPLDKNINSLPIPGCRETSLKARLTAYDIGKKLKTGSAIQIDESGLAFLPVYLLKNESLHELSNDTVHALIHFGWILKDNGFYTATLSIYVKSRGRLGAFYLKAIEPFRRHIVYPTIMKNIKNQWQKRLVDHK